MGLCKSITVQVPKVVAAGTVEYTCILHKDEDPAGEHVNRVRADLAASPRADEVGLEAVQRGV